MVVAGRVLADGDVAIMMVEAESTEQTWDLVRGGKTAPTEEVVASGLEAAKPFIKALCDAQAELAAHFPKTTAEFPIFADYADDVYAAVSDTATAELSQVMSIADKQDREEATEALKAKLVGQLSEQFAGREKEITGAYRALTKKLVRQKILTDKVRIDGRGLSDIRTLSAEVDVIPRVHGSALFQRGETQILGVTTLNMLGMEQKLDTLAPETTKRYMHNYNFPPYSTGETGRVGSPKRREIGHGALAERALLPVLPTREEFPYAIRQVSEALGSNGSTSMGSVCASTLAPAERRCAAARAGRRHRHGPGLRHRRRRDALRRADRHPRGRGRLRRHGLQGRRHQGLHHRPAAGHQARRHPGRRSSPRR